MFCSSGSNGAISGAASTSRNVTTTSISPSSESGLFFRKRQASRERPGWTRNATGDGAGAVSPPSRIAPVIAYLTSPRSADANAWVEDAVQDVHDQIDADVDRRDQHRDAHHGRKVEVGRR